MAKLTERKRTMRDPTISELSAQRDKWIEAAVKQQSRAKRAEDALAAKDTALSEMRRAIIGGEPDATVTHGQFLEMIRLAEDARLGAIARATAAEAELERAEALAGCAAKACHLTPAALAQLASDAEAFLVRLDALAPSIQDETDLGARG